MSISETAKTKQTQTLTPIIVRIKNTMDMPMYVTAYDGDDIGKISLPMTLDGNDKYSDVAYFASGANRWDWIYLGHDKNGQSLTIYFKEDSDGVLKTEIGEYKGRKEQPGELDPKYASAQPLFFDGKGNLIMQFNLYSYYAGSEKSNK